MTQIGKSMLWSSKLQFETVFWKSWMKCTPGKSYFFKKYVLLYRDAHSISNIHSREGTIKRYIKGTWSKICCMPLYSVEYSVKYESDLQIIASQIFWNQGCIVWFVFYQAPAYTLHHSVYTLCKKCVSQDSKNNQTSLSDINYHATGQVSETRKSPENCKILWKK